MNDSTRLDQNASPDFISSLRDATRAWHDRVEARLLPPGAWTPGHYRRMLETFDQVISPIESRLCDLLGDAFIAPPPATRATQLRLDLDALGRRASPLLAGAPLRVEAHADAFGVGYVFQGSLLGGAVIARQLRASAGTASLSTNYLRLYGDGLGAAWRRFTGAANAFGRQATAVERTQATQAAVEAFRAFDDAFDRCA